MPTNQTANTPEEDPRRVLNPAELAARWGKCRQTIYNMIESGELHSFKVRNSRLVPLSEIDRIERGEAA